MSDTLTKVEFDVLMRCQNCVNKIREAIESLPSIENVDISLETGSVVVTSTLTSSTIQDAIESTGSKAVLKGYGSGIDALSKSVSAVATMGSENGYGVGSVRGVIRFVQVNSDKCIIDGIIDGLSPGEHGLHIHECGDITEGCDSLGVHFNLRNTKHGGPNDDESSRHTGDLGNVTAAKDGRATFRIFDQLINVYDIIGRSIVVTEGKDDLGRGVSPLSEVNGNAGKRLACGIISRSAGIFENRKKICACSGLTLWDERENPKVKVPASSSLCTYI